MSSFATLYKFQPRGLFVMYLAGKVLFGYIHAANVADFGLMLFHGVCFLVKSVISIISGWKKKKGT